MSKKNYEAMASIIKLFYVNARTIGVAQFKRPRPVEVSKALQAQLLEMAEMLCEQYEDDNPRFDEEKFMRACGFTPIAYNVLGVVDGFKWGTDIDIAQALVDNGHYPNPVTQH